MIDFVLLFNYLKKLCLDAKNTTITAHKYYVVINYNEFYLIGIKKNNENDEKNRNYLL